MYIFEKKDERDDMGMNFRRICVWFLLICFMVSFLSGCNAISDGLRFGTGGIYYAYGNAAAPLIEEATGLKVEIRNTTGSAANLRLLQNDMLHLAIVQSDTLQYATTGKEDFASGALSGYSAVAGLYTEACQIVATKSSGITSVADLAGKRVSIGEEDSGVTPGQQHLLSGNYHMQCVGT